MRITVVIAKFDGVPAQDGIAFAPDCEFVINGQLPVVHEFKLNLPPIGRALRLQRQGPDLIADLDVWGTGIAGKFPSCGGVPIQTTSVLGGPTIVSKFKLVAIGLSARPNADLRIPPIGLVSVGS